MKKLVVKALTIVLLFMASFIQAEAIPLIDLKNGAELQSGGLRFFDWNALWSGLEGDVSILDQADISIIPNQGANPGLLFDFNGKLTIGGGGGPPPIATPLISFQVATIDGQSTITGASVTLTSGLGDVFIDKGLCKDAQCDNLIEDIFVNPSIPSASTNIPPQNQIFVLDGLSLAASGAVPAPFIDTFEQHFYVTAPEPSTVILIIIGLAGFGVGIRRRLGGHWPTFSFELRGQPA